MSDAISSQEFRLLLELGQDDARAAVHECGHAIIQWESPFALRSTAKFPVLVLDGPHSRFSFRHDETKKTIDRSWDLLMIDLGGLASEQVAGCPDWNRRRAPDFLARAKGIARQLAAGARWNRLPLPSWLQYEFFPTFSYMWDNDPGVVKYIDIAYNLSVVVLNQRKSELLELARLLMEHKTLQSYHIRRVCGPRRIDRCS